MKTKNSLEQKFLQQALSVMQDGTILSAREIITFSMLTLYYKRSHNDSDCKEIWTKIDKYLSPIAMANGDEILKLLKKIKPFIVDNATMDDFLTVSIYGCGNQSLWREVDGYLYGIKQKQILKGTSIFCLPDFVAGTLECKPLRRMSIFCTLSRIEERIAEIQARLQKKQWCLDNFDTLNPAQQEEAKEIILGR